MKYLHECRSQDWYSDCMTVNFIHLNSLWFEMDSQLSSFSVFSTDLKRIQTILGFLSRKNLYSQLVRSVRRQSSSLSPSLSPCQSSGNCSLKLFQKKIKGFGCKIMGQAFGGSCSAELEGLLQDCKAQTQDVSKSDAVAEGSNRLAWGNIATTFALLTY